MIHKLKPDDPDITCAKAILDKGWRQGTVFDPCGILENIQLTDGELLILWTQSCTVVSSRFATDPIVEAMVIKLFPKYNPKAFEATGKNQRKLHIEMISSSQFKCIECDINRRFFFDRHHLLNIDPLQELEIGVEGSTKLAGWLGRSYTRIALPNLLVERVKPELLTLILKCLDEKQTNGQNIGSLIDESVSFIYLDRQPRHDAADLFELKFIFLFLTQYAFSRWNAKRIEIRCDPENTKSAAIPKRLGFLLEAHFKNHRIQPVSNKLSGTIVFVCYGPEGLPKVEYQLRDEDG